MAAPVWQQKQMSAAAGLVNAYTPTMPSGITSGNLLVMAILVYSGTGGGGAIDTPSGWTQACVSSGMGFGSACKGYVFYKLAGSSNPAPNLTGVIGNIHVEISEVSGADPTTPVAASASGTPSATTTVPTPASTATVSDSLVMWFAFENNATVSWTVNPAGGAQRYSDVGSPTSFTQRCVDKTENSGDVSANSFTRSVTTYTAVAHTIVINPVISPFPSGTMNKIKFGTGLSVIDEGSGVIRVDNMVFSKDIQIKVIDDATVLTTGDGKLILCIPASLGGRNLSAAHAFITTVSSSGLPTVQIRNITQAVDMLSTRITIDVSEFSSYSAAAAPVIDTGNDDVATGDLIAIDVDVAGTGAKGLGVILTFT